MLFDNNMLRVVKSDELNGAKRGRKGTNLRKQEVKTVTIYKWNDTLHRGLIGVK